MSQPLPETRRHWVEVRLTDPSGNIWTGKGAVEAAARTSAKNLAKDRGGFTQVEVDAFPEDVWDLVGPHPRTFVGNPNAPDDLPGPP